MIYSVSGDKGISESFLLNPEALNLLLYPGSSFDVKQKESKKLVVEMMALLTVWSHHHQDDEIFQYFLHQSQCENYWGNLSSLGKIHNLAVKASEYCSSSNISEMTITYYNYNYFCQFFSVFLVPPSEPWMNGTSHLEEYSLSHDCREILATWVSIVSPFV